METCPVGVVVLDAAGGAPVSLNREAQRLLAGLETVESPMEQLRGWSAGVATAARSCSAICLTPRRCTPLRPGRTPAKAAAGAMRHARRCVGEGSQGGSSAHGACHYPAGERGRIGAKRVVTGAKIGLRASGGKGIAKKIPRAAFVTRWYGAAIHRAATGSVVG